MVLCFFLQSEEQKMVSGIPKGNNNLILPLQKQLAGQLCLEAVIALGLWELFCFLFCFSLQENRVIHARPYEGCYIYCS